MRVRVGVHVNEDRPAPTHPSPLRVPRPLGVFTPMHRFTLGASRSPPRARVSPLACAGAALRARRRPTDFCNTNDARARRRELAILSPCAAPVPRGDGGSSCASRSRRASPSCVARASGERAKECAEARSPPRAPSCISCRAAACARRTEPLARLRTRRALRAPHRPAKGAAMTNAETHSTAGEPVRAWRSLSALARAWPPRCAVVTSLEERPPSTRRACASAIAPSRLVLTSTFAIRRSSAPATASTTKPARASDVPRAS
jgi:hypothetical protein